MASFYITARGIGYESNKEKLHKYLSVSSRFSKKLQLKCVRGLLFLPGNMSTATVLFTIGLQLLLEMDFSVLLHLYI